MAVSGSKASACSSALATLYRTVWRVCAGWNRCAFGTPQLAFIRKRSKLLLLELPLGSIEGMTMRFDGRSVVVINRLFFARRAADHDDLLALLGSEQGAYARFVFLHEIAHHLFHDGAFLHTPWADKASEVRSDIEADFYALLAMVPDKVVESLLHSGRERAVLSVAARLGARYALSPQHEARILELADYRVTLCEMYWPAFAAISSTSFEDRPGRNFRNVRTLDRNVDVAEQQVSFDTTPILMLHPNVKRDVSLRDALLATRVRPFDLVAAAPEWELSASQPLTHRLDPDRLLAHFDPTEISETSESEPWRSVD